MGGDFHRLCTREEERVEGGGGIFILWAEDIHWVAAPLPSPEKEATFRTSGSFLIYRETGEIKIG